MKEWTSGIDKIKVGRILFQEQENMCESHRQEDQSMGKDEKKSHYD